MRPPSSPVSLSRGISFRVVEHGFEFRGTMHKSLSEIARLITGTRWSGPLFFGLKPRAIQAVEPRLGARGA